MQPRSLLAALLVGALASVSPAHAQGIIPDVIASTIANANSSHNGPSVPCMRGEPPSAQQIAEARAGAQATMQDYLARAGASTPADVTPAFTRRESERAWVSAGVKGVEAAIDDPLAHAVAAGTGRAAPVAFIRSGDGHSAHGVWLVTSADGATRLGQYDVMFRREGGGLRITHLVLRQGDGEAVALRQFCQNPGDVELYLAGKKGP